MSSPPPLEYLVTSSKAGLENFELGKMNKIANLRKELRDLVEEWIEAEIQSRLARWILECRRTQDDAHTQPSECDAPLLVDDVAASLFPPSHRQPEPPETRPLRMAELSDSFPLSRRSTRTPEHPLSMLRPKLSERAEDALTFLEQQGRSETAAIGIGPHKSEPQTDRTGPASGSTSHAGENRRVHNGSGAAPLFSDSVERFEVVEYECSGPVERIPVINHRAVADSAGSADLARVVPLVRREHPRPSVPVRASMRFSPPQRRAV
jgi:hypothetical protein